jgi:c-di-GMP-binding flagellar brake protein YcgR
VTVRTEVLRDGKPSISFGRGENISEGGMMLESSQAYSLNEVVKVRFVLPASPQGAVVTSEAKIVWAGPGAGVGLEFLGMKDEDREAIARFVAAA